MTDDDILADMRLAFEADKNAGEPTGWRTGSRPDSLTMTVPLDVMGPTIGTAWLSFRAMARSPDRDCSISLLMTYVGRDLQAWRMDWRPLHHHTNLTGPKELRGLRSDTGVHDFASNAQLGLKRMQSNNLPLCLPVIDEPHDFDAFVRYAFLRLRVARTEPIPSPPWSPTLL